MGNDHHHKAIPSDKAKGREAAPSSDPLNLKKYNKISVIGRGGFGRVQQYSHRFGNWKAKKIKSCMP
jgi:uncharacterized protein YgiB involved in biofilm formation